MQKLLQELSNKNDRSAHFKTVIALVGINDTKTFEGICEGEITNEKQGEQGFGYDPIFKPNGYSETFAQMSLSTKNKIGHRGKAVQQLITFINNLNNQ